MGDVSMDSSSNSTFEVSADLIDSTPIEKCSLNPRRKNSRRLLTGFIIYASEVRRQVVEQHPDQNFGYISRLVGDKWRALSSEIRFKYHQRALIHNRRMKEQAQRDGITLGGPRTPKDLTNGSHRKLSKKKLAKLAAKKGRLAQSAGDPSGLEKTIGVGGDDTISDLQLNGNGDNSFLPDTSSSSSFQQHSDHQYVQQQQHQTNGTETTASKTTSRSTTAGSRSSKKTNCVDSSTQTPSIRFVEPPPKKPLMYSDIFLKRLEELKRLKEIQSREEVQC